MTRPSTPPEQELLTDCGGKMKDPADYPSAEFHGRRIYFCNALCLAAFKSDPERFMAGDIEHPV